jgi:hypothetical protein
MWIMNSNRSPGTMGSHRGGDSLRGIEVLAHCRGSHAEEIKVHARIVAAMYSRIPGIS